MRVIRSLMPPVGIAVLLGVSYFAVVDLTGSVYLAADMAVAGCLALGVVGLVIQLGGAHQFSLGQGGFLAIGAYGTGVAVTHFSIPAGWAILITVAGTAILSWPIGRILNRLNELYFTVATLAFTLITTSVVHQLGEYTGGEDGLGVPPLQVGSWTLVDPDQKFWVAWGAAILAAMGASSYLRSRRGRGLRAVGGDEHAARALGVPAAALKTQAFVLSSALAALGGSLLVFVSGFVHPGEFAVNASIELLVIVVLGFATPYRSLVVALAIALLPALFEPLQPHLELIYGAALVVVLVTTSRGWSAEKVRAWLAGGFRTANRGVAG
jgi:branched-chain amino acid transport system permease protein